MKNLLLLTILGFLFSTSFFAQNVGVGTTSPTNTLHVKVDPLNPAQDPIKIEGLLIYTNETSVLAIDPITGVVKHMPINAVLASVDSSYLDSTILTTVLNNIDTIFSLMRDSLLLDSTFMNTLRDSIDTDIDSMIFANDTLYLYEDNQVLTAYINASLDTALVDSLILAKSDTLYSIISDSLNKDTLWIKQLDSLLSIYGDTIYFNDSSYTLVRDSLLNDSIFLDSLISLIKDSIDTDIDSMIFANDTLYLYEDNQVLATYIPILDSNHLDSIYSFVSDSLLGDTLWIDSLGKLLNDADWDINSNGTGLEAAAAGSNIASGNYAIAAGFNDTATGNFAGVVSGQANTTEHDHTFIGGGQNNVIKGINNPTHSSIVGGLNNTMSDKGYYSTISGGQNNTVSQEHATITGGRDNFVNGAYSIVGGYQDTALGSYSGVLSGRQNSIRSGSYTSIPGGYQNKVINSTYGNVSGYQNYANTSFSSLLIHGYRDTAIRSVEGTVIGGRENASIAISPAMTGHNTIFGFANKITVLTGNNSHTHTVVGGLYNKIIGALGTGNSISIFGGNYNTIDAGSFGGGSAGIFAGTSHVMGGPWASGNSRSIIIGGSTDTLYGGHDAAMVAGIWNKINSSHRAGIFVGRNNELTSSARATIIGGFNNTINSGGTGSSIIAGDSNTIDNSADHAIILGGTKNTANNYAQVALGHYSSNAVPAGSSSSAIDPDNILFKIGNGIDASNLNDAMVVMANGNAGVNTSAPTNQLHIAGGTDPIRAEGLQYGGTTDSVLVTNGTGVVKLASVNSITRVCGNYVFTNLNGETVVSHSLFCIANNRTFTLPAANTVTGRKYVVKLENVPFTATISAVAGNIDGGASYEMVGAGVSSVILQSDGANYWIIGSH